MRIDGSVWPDRSKRPVRLTASGTSFRGLCLVAYSSHPPGGRVQVSPSPGASSAQQCTDTQIHSVLSRIMVDVLKEQCLRWCPRCSRLILTDRTHVSSPRGLSQNASALALTITMPRSWSRLYAWLQVRLAPAREGGRRRRATACPRCRARPSLRLRHHYVALLYRCMPSESEIMPLARIL